MPQNDFVPFATGAGANVYSPAAYAAQPARSNGVQAGVADPVLANNSWRQGTVMASMIGSFMVAAGYDARDNGDLTTLLANFQAAITTLAQSGAPGSTSLLHSGSDTSSTANTITIPTVTPDVPSLADFQVYEVVPANSNTGATSITIKAFSSLPLLKRDGGQVASGDLVAGSPYLIVKLGSSFRLLSLARSEVINTVTSSNTIIQSGSINPIANSATYLLTPTSGSTFSRSLSFTAPSNGVVQANGNFIVANSPSPTDTNGNGPSMSLLIAGSSSGSANSGASTIYTIQVPTTKSVTKGETVTVTVTIAFPGTTSSFPASQTSLTYIFVPSA